jgi:Domain of unknown function (DUF6249)
MAEVIAILIPITFFVMIAALVIVPRYFKSMERQKLADTLRAAIDKGQTLPPDIISAMSADVKTAPVQSPQRDLRTGVIWLGVAVGLAAFGIVLGYYEDADATVPLIAIATFPGFIGLAFIILSLLNKTRS